MGNTAAAIQRTLALGADGFECDVRFSRDGKIFLLHDETLQRTASWSPPPGMTLPEYASVLMSPVKTLDWDLLSRIELGQGMRLIQMRSAVSLLPPDGQCLIEVKGSDLHIVPLCFVTAPIARTELQLSQHSASTRENMRLQWSRLRSGRMKVLGHRGSMGDLPENTAAAIQRTLALGAARLAFIGFD